MKHYLPLLALLASLATPGFSHAQEPPTQPERIPEKLKIVKVEVRPAAIQLQSPFDYRQLLIMGTTADGEQVDLTRVAQAEAVPAVVQLTPTRQVRAKADGEGVLTFAYAGQKVSVPVRVAGTKARYEVSYVRDVMPILAKLGCNSGTCHGAAEGKAGFRLSLRGYDPIGDHRALTDDLEGRRFNRAAPEKSLMLMKPSGAVPHVGGVLCLPGEPYYELLKLWIAEGVKLDTNAPRVRSIEVFPQGATVPLIGMKQQMTVIATYTDGSTRDVTAESFIESSNTEIATVDKHGIVTAVRRGEATMLARFEGAYAAASLIVMGDRTGFVWNNPPTNNWIDELVYRKLQQVKVLPADLCSDADFVRRVHLDLTGMLPEPETVRAFLADPRPTRVKRDELIDRLVGSPGYVEHWANKWGDLLQVNRKFLGDRGAAVLRSWIRQAIAENRPYDQFAYELLTARGSNMENPAAAYFKILRTPDTAMENTTHLFMAVRFNCNKCHDHPFERWTQDQYYQLASFFAQVTRREDPNYQGQRIGGTAVEGAQPLVEIIADSGGGEVRHERTGELVKPQFPFTHASMPKPEGSRREQLARWLTSKDNPYFAKSYVNRIWSYLLGVGLIEPVDDIRAGNPPTNPALLERLTAEFVQSGFDTQALIRTICKSRTYQHSIETNRWNEDDQVNYSHALARRLPAEVLYDAIHQATGSITRLPGLPPGARAAQLLDSNVPIPGSFLELFGKAPRESACECERSSGVDLRPVLAFVNGPVVGEALRDPNNRIAKLVATYPDDRKLVEELFLAFLSRLPTPKEIELGVKAIEGGGDDYKKQLADYEKAQADLKALEAQMPQRLASWEREVRRPITWQTLELTGTSKGGAKLEKQPDGAIRVTGPNPYPELYTLSATLKDMPITAIRLEALPDAALPAGGPGRAPNGNFVVSEFKLAVAKGQAKAKAVPISRAIASFSQDGWPVQAAIDNNPATGWAVAPHFGKAHTAVFELAQPIDGKGEFTLTIMLDQQYPGKDHNLGHFRLSVTSAKGPIQLGSNLPPAIVQILDKPAEQRTPQEQKALMDYYRPLDAELARLTRAVANRPQPGNSRLLGAQDLAWALMNTPAFLFNR